MPEAAGTNGAETITEKEKEFVLSVVRRYLQFSIKIFLSMPLICAIGIPALWVMQAFFSALGFAGLLFFPAAYIAIRLISKLPRVLYQLAIYFVILAVGYGFLIFSGRMTREVLTVMAGITAFFLVFFLPFIVYYLLQYRKISRGEFALERRIAQGRVDIRWASRKPIARVGNYLLSDLTIYKKKDPALYEKILSALSHNSDATLELALGRKGYMKGKNIILKIDDWSLTRSPT